MLLSRFWYIVLSLLLGASVFMLYIAHGVASRTATRTMGELLTAATNSVEWYLRDHAHQRAAELTDLTFHPDVQAALSAAADAESLATVKERDKVKSALRAFAEKKGFAIVWAIDVNGRVVGTACTLQVCASYEQAAAQPDFEMGGYALVADALHGWVRDDTWVFDDQMYRVVARPVEQKVNDQPIGAIVGANHVNDAYVEAIAARVGTAVAFFAGGNVAKGVPPDSSAVRSDLEVTTEDLKKLVDNKDYNEKGRTAADALRLLPKHTVGAVFSRLPGESWDSGAGYAVIYRQLRAASPLDYQGVAEEADKKSVPWLYIALIAAGSSVLGIFFSLLEHTRPLARFRRAVHELGKGKSDVLKPGSFRGTYKKIASDVNDALDKVAAKSGIERGPADLESVLGPLPAQPQMSAFAVPKGDELPVKERSLPKAPKPAPTPPPVEPGTLPSAGLAPEEREAVARAMA
ncbi:MAG: hypothetical protein HY908_02525, partial [Myxococcales bacterium]|nr:hypothetical protein [Myxococcales bacterium]